MNAAGTAASLPEFRSMTERIDLDDLDEATDSTDDDRREGDWFWRGGDDVPENRPGEGWTTDATGADGAGAADSQPRPAGEANAGSESATTGEASSGDDAAEGSDTADAVGGNGSPRRDDTAPVVPHVPTTNDGDPVGIPASSGGAGAGQGAAPEGGGVPSNDTPAGGDGSSESEPEGDGTSTGEDARTGVGTAAAHGNAEPDDMTMAFTYGAVQRLADPGAAFADVERWCDWVGMVGDVHGHVLNKFQRDQRLDLDFFNGSGTGPGERLDEIDERSMFFADRMVVVGLPDEEWVAAEADWEFVPLEHASGEAGWELTDADAAT